MFLSNMHFMYMVPVTFGHFFLKSLKNGPFWAKLKMFRGGFHHVPDFSGKNPSEFE